MTFEDFKRSPLAPSITRCFHRYTSTQRADLQASHRAGHRQRSSTGEFFYVREDKQGFGYASRGAALRAAFQEFLAAPSSQKATA